MQRQAIWHAHREYVQGLLYTLATDRAMTGTRGDRLSGAWGLCADEFQSTGGIPPSLYVREARRLVGDRVFHQNTPKAKSRPARSHERDSATGGHPASGGASERDTTSAGDDTIGLGCYPFDSHATRRVVCRRTVHQGCIGQGTGAASPHGVVTSATAASAAEGGEAAVTAATAATEATAVHFAWNEGEVGFNIGPYRIPFWTMLPKRAEVSNLVAVSTPSASHVGFSSLRMEPQFMILGHAAGVAAALALNRSSDAAAADAGGRAPRESDVDFHTLPRGVVEAALRAAGAKLDPRPH